jgi:hypothetical protein
LTTNLILNHKKLSRNATRHSERSEESIIWVDQTLHFVQGDSFWIVNKRLFDKTTYVSCRSL